MFERLVSSIVVWLIFIAAALLEVGGDAVVRKGLLNSKIVYIVTGGFILTGYSVLVNEVYPNDYGLRKIK